MNTTRRRLPSVPNLGRLPTRLQWDELQPTVKKLYRDEGKTMKEIIKAIEAERGFLVTERMLRQRIKKWGLAKNHHEKDIKAALRLFRSAEKDGAGTPQINVRSRPITKASIVEYYRKKVPKGINVFDMPTPTASQAPTPADMEVKHYVEEPFKAREVMDWFDASPGSERPTTLPLLMASSLGSAKDISHTKYRDAGTQTEDPSRAAAKRRCDTPRGDSMFTDPSLSPRRLDHFGPVGPLSEARPWHGPTEHREEKDNRRTLDQAPLWGEIPNLPLSEAIPDWSRLEADAVLGLTMLDRSTPLVDQLWTPHLSFSSLINI